MGSLWAAEHRALGMEVAVKFMLPEMLEWKKGHPLKRFWQEAKAAAQIKSPHVVQMLDRGRMPDGTPYLVMELLRGETLAERLTRCEKMAAAEVADVVTQIARALTAAHKQHIVHRDIKPGNVFMVDVGGQVFCKVLDFGIAKRTSGEVQDWKTATGMMMGVPHYLSPERLHGRPTSGQVDLWALAVLAYRSLTGTLPFQGPTMPALCFKIFTGAFPTPSEVEPGLDSALDAWFQKALAPLPQDRFANAGELARTFRAAIEGCAPEEGCTPPEATMLSSAPSATEDEAPVAAASGASTTPRAFAGSLPSVDAPDLEPTASVVTGAAPLPRRQKRLEALVAATVLAVGATGVGLHYAIARGGEAAAGGRASRPALVTPVTATLSKTAALLMSNGQPKTAAAARAQGSAAELEAAIDLDAPVEPEAADEPVNKVKPAARTSLTSSRPALGTAPLRVVPRAPRAIRACISPSIEKAPPDEFDLDDQHTNWGF